MDDYSNLPVDLLYRINSKLDIFDLQNLRHANKFFLSLYYDMTFWRYKIYRDQPNIGNLNDLTLPQLLKLAKCIAETGQVYKILTADNILKMTDFPQVNQLILGPSQAIFTTSEGQLYNTEYQRSDRINSHFSLISIPQPDYIIKIACGLNHTVYMTIRGEIYVYGNNGNGRLGILGISELVTPQKLSLPPMKDLACGNSHTALVTETGELYTFGYNYFGQLGHKHTKDVPIPTQVSLPHLVTQVACGAYTTVYLTTKGEVYTFGDNQTGQLGLGYEAYPRKITVDYPMRISNLPPNIKNICCGRSHAAAITGNGKVFIWGHNGYGQLGIGHYGDAYLPVLMDIPEPISKIACGSYITVLVSPGNNIYVSGGMDKEDNYVIPQLIKFSHPIKRIFCGTYESGIIV